MTKVTKFNISKPRKYQDKEGNEKTQWNNIGTMTVFQKEDGKINRIIEIPTIGLEANVFPWTPREDKKAEETYNQTGQSDNEGVDVDSVPF